MRDCTYLLVDGRFSSPSLLELASAFGWLLCCYDGSNRAAETKLLSDLTTNRRIGTDTPGGNFTLMAEEIAQFCHSLLAYDQARYRILCQECAVIIETIARSVTRQQIEQEIVEQIGDNCQTAGITPLKICVAIGQCPRLCSRTIWQREQFSTRLSLQLTASRGGLETTVSRMAVLGELPQSIVEMYRAIVEMGTCYLDLARPGRSMHEVQARVTAYRESSSTLRYWWSQMRASAIGYRLYGESARLHPQQPMELNEIINCSVNVGNLGLGGTFMVLPERNEWLTITDNWPMLAVTLDNKTHYVPDILRL